MEDRWRGWIERELGGRVVDATRGHGGGSRELWFVDVECRGASVAAVLRVETGGGAFAGTPISLAREAVVYRALQNTDVPVPRLYGATHDGAGLLLERATGSVDLRGRDAGQRRALRDDFLGALVALHALDTDTLDLPGFDRPAAAEDHARSDLATWQALLSSRTGPPDPLLLYALAWLDAYAPAAVGRTALVQGDTGPGNFLADGERVTAVVDWEFAHLGDPVDDLAWLDLRTSSAPGGAEVFGSLAGRCLAYERLGGTAVDPARLRYYRVFAHARCAVTTAITIHRGGGALGLFGYHAAHHRFCHQLAWAMVEATGMPRPAPVSVVDAPDTGRTPLFDRAIADLTDHVLPALDDRGARLRVNGTLALLRHLRQADRLDPLLATAERDERRALLGVDVSDDALRQAAAEGGRTGDPDVLAHLLARAERGAARWAGALGAPLPEPLPPVPDRWDPDLEEAR